MLRCAPATTKAPLIAKVQSIINLQAMYSLAVVHTRRSQLIPLFPCLALSEIKRKQLIICLQLRHSGGRLTRPFSSDLASSGRFKKRGTPDQQTSLMWKEVAAYRELRKGQFGSLSASTPAAGTFWMQSLNGFLPMGTVASTSTFSEWASLSQPNFPPPSGPWNAMGQDPGPFHVPLHTN